MFLSSILTTILALAGFPDPQPYLGVSTSVHGQPIAVAGQTFKHGLMTEFVAPGSGAAAAGLRAGDVIVGIVGASFDCPSDQLLERFREAIRGRQVGDTLALTLFRDEVETQARLGDEPLDDGVAWKDPEGFVAGKPVGTRLELTATRVARLLTVEVTLGPRPTAGGPRVIPPNEEIMPEPVARLPEEKLSEALLRRFDAETEYAALRKRLAGLVERGDAFRLSRVAYAMREPFALAGLSRDLAGVPRDLAGALAHAAVWMDRPVGHVAPHLRGGLSPQAHAEQIAALLTEAGKLYEAAFVALRSDERKLLEETLADVTDSFREVVMVLSDEDKQRVTRVRRFVELAEKVDTSKLIAAAIHLSALTSDEYLDALAEDLADQGPGIILSHETPFGPIIFAGHGNTWHSRPAAVIIDLGGYEHYTQQTGGHFAIVIDLGGDDTYQATFAESQGSGLFGIGLLYDREGDDVYVGGQWAQGSAALGVGVLWDRCGNDTYRAADYSQATALCGVGLLIDDAGDDRYNAARYAQALGMPGGFGALIDRDGGDYYFCGGRDLTNYGTPGVFDAFGQGCGIGFRGLASGGIALLLDEAGDDTYVGHNFAQGGGYYFGWGCLVDRAGDDRYLGSRYAQAWAAHQALGFLEDHAGNDFYQCWRGVGQSCSWDETVTMLLDQAGDDIYSGGGFALCAAHNTGWAVLVDYAGRDLCEQFGGVPRADGDDEVTSFSLHLDLGGDEDIYPDEGPNDLIKHGNRHGFFGDLPGDLDAAIGGLDELIGQ